MKRKIIAAVMAAVMAFLLCSCSFTADKDRIIDFFNDCMETVGMLRLTIDRDLKGRRVFTGDDAYEGTYSVQLDGESRQEVIFGGISVYERRIRLTADISAVSGNAVIIVQSGNTATGYSAGKDGKIDETALLNGNGYVIISYDDFEGEIELNVSIDEE